MSSAHAPALRLLRKLPRSTSIRSTTLSIAGSVSGILGLTNLSGFYFYLLSQLLVSLAIIFLNAHAAPAAYLLPPALLRVEQRSARVHDKVHMSASSGGAAQEAAQLQQAPARVGVAGQAWMWTRLLLLEGLTDNALSYVLWWTFWFGLVHVYD